MATTRCVVPDPDGSAWLTLEQASVDGALVWIVVGQYAGRAQAERAADLHASPIVHWLLHDATFGWRRPGGKGWMHEPSGVTAHSRAEAEAIAAADPGVTLYVLRANGLVTCPDLPADG